jgi:hypothetical protein
VERSIEYERQKVRDAEAQRDVERNNVKVIQTRMKKIEKELEAAKKAKADAEK